MLFRNFFYIKLYALLTGLLFIAVSFGCGKYRSHTARPAAATHDVRPNAININTATAEELRSLPHIGEVLADRIVTFRNTHGPFRRAEYLLLVPGISDARFREVRDLVKVE